MQPAKFYVRFSFLWGLGSSMAATVYVPFLLSLGLSLADVAILNALFWIVIVLAELPTGMFADGKSRAWSVQMGVVCAIVSPLMYATARGMIMSFAAELVMGIAFAFLSGAQQAWVTDALKRCRAKKGVLEETITSAAIWKALGAMFGGVVGALIGSLHLRLVWIVEGLVFVALFVLCRLEMKEQGEPEQRATEIEALRQSVQVLRGNRSLRWLVVVAMCSGLILPFNHYWAPFFRARVGQAALGWLWVPFYLAMALPNVWLRRRGSFKGVEAYGIVLSLILMGGGLASIGLFAPFASAVAFTLMHEIGRGLMDPCAELFMQNRIESQHRATYGSLQSFLGRMGYGAVLFVVWLLTRGAPSTNATIVTTWKWSGGLLVASAAVLWMFRPKSSLVMVEAVDAKQEKEVANANAA